jgi:hypothetical protein
MLGVAVLMRRLSLGRRHQPSPWQAMDVLTGLQLPAGAARCLQSNQVEMRWLFGGLTLALHAAEVADYCLNLDSANPSWFVAWRQQGELAIPYLVSLSSRQAAAWQATGAQVDAVPAAADSVARLRQAVGRLQNG